MSIELQENISSTEKRAKERKDAIIEEAEEDANAINVTLADGSTEPLIKIALLQL